MAGGKRHDMSGNALGQREAGQAADTVDGLKADF